MIKKIVYGMYAIIGIGVVIVYWLHYGFDTIAIRDSLYLSTVTLTLLGSWFALTKYGFRNVRTVTLACLAGAATFFFIGEWIYEYHYVVLKSDVPFPSFNDMSYLIAYVLLFSGLANEIRLAELNWKKINKVLLTVLLMITVVLSIVVYKFGIVSAYDPHEPVLTNIVLIGYSVGDLIFIVTSLFLVLMVSEYRGGRFSRIWLLLAIAFLIELSGDLMKEFHLNDYHKDVWIIKTFMDSTYMAFYLCYAAAFFEFAFSIMDALKQAGKVDMEPVVIKPQETTTTTPEIVEPQKNS